MGPLRKWMIRKLIGKHAAIINLKMSALEIVISLYRDQELLEHNSFLNGARVARAVMYMRRNATTTEEPNN